MSFLTRLSSLLGLSSPISVAPPGAALAATVTVPASLGFVPVAIHFDLFNILVVHGGPATADEVSAICNSRIKARGGHGPELSARLASDTLYIMAGLGLVDRVAEDCFTANAITNHMVAMPSAQHGALHFTTEGLMAGAFLMKKLQDTRFAYPFADADGPLQYAYRLMASGTVTGSHTSSATMVDISSGRGELLLEVQAAHPHLGAEDLIVQEFNANIDNVPGVHFME
ncbi:O-methyltransferase family 2 [Penicillium cf. griseofulvum]|nr:O-methyltransferase family 2 [Penicillium cf. griseofulvum]KAJ5437145.1 O-methyltransferase family 2 [Penicillium cf. griseofulvum]